GAVVGLAPSAAAARVLAAEIGAPAETTAQWTAQQAGAARRERRVAELERRAEQFAAAGYRSGKVDAALESARTEWDRWRLQAGQLVIVDEAGMADTKRLDAVVGQARAAGAKVALVGDPAQ